MPEPEYAISENPEMRFSVRLQGAHKIFRGSYANITSRDVLHSALWIVVIK